MCEEIQADRSECSVYSEYEREKQFKEIVLTPGKKALTEMTEEERLGERKGSR